MKVKTKDLTDAALDWAVAVALGGTGLSYDTVATFWITIDGKERALRKGWAESQSFTPSTDWREAGPIIEREFITLRTNACVPGHWAAFIDFGSSNTNIKARQSGPTPLIAAMRCYVASELGDDVEVPDILLGETP